MRRRGSANRLRMWRRIFHSADSQIAATRASRAAPYRRRSPPASYRARGLRATKSSSENPNTRAIRRAISSSSSSASPRSRSSASRFKNPAASAEHIPRTKKRGDLIMIASHVGIRYSGFYSGKIVDPGCICTMEVGNANLTPSCSKPCLIARFTRWLMSMYRSKSEVSTKYTTSIFRL